MFGRYQSHLREQYFEDTLKKQRAEASGNMVAASETLDELRREKEVLGREAQEASSNMEVLHPAVDRTAP